MNFIISVHKDRYNAKKYRTMAMNRQSKYGAGFLLIELGAVLALIGILVLIISLGLAKNVVMSHETKMRLRALTIATSTLNAMRLGYESALILPDYQIRTEQSEFVVNQRTIDTILTAQRDEKRTVRAFHVAVAWKGADGTLRTIRLMTAWDIGKEGV
jgi:type II secretory pathway pseudopilin PulG